MVKAINRMRFCAPAGLNLIPCLVLAVLTLPAIAATTPATAQSGPAIEKPDEEPSVLPSSGSAGGHALSTRASVKVTQFKYEGNTVFSSEELCQVVHKTLARLHKPVAGEYSLDDLEDIRLALSQYYVDHGYITSGAILPDQNVDSGVIAYRMVEGRVSDVPVTFRDKNGKPTNHHLLRQNYIISRVKYGSGPPLNIIRLKDQLELLRLDNNVKSINAELKPGVMSGDSIMDVQIQETNPFQLGLQFSNRRPPSVGSIAVDMIASDSDLTGHGDSLSVRYDVASGMIQDIRPAGAKDFSIDYSIPFTPADTTFSINFSRTDTVVVDDVFAPLNIGSESDSGSITVRQPLYRKPIAEPATADHPGNPSAEFDVFVTGSLRDNHTTLMGQAFDFTKGDHNGGEHVTAVRFGQELTLRNERDAFSGRSTFSLGVPWFDSTHNPRGVASGQFFDWLGQVQYAHLIAKSDVQLVLRASAQFSDRSLLILEQYSLGGADSIRGYPENFLLRDDAVTGAIEFRIPVLHKNAADMLTFIPFFDAGYGYNRSHLSGKPQTLDAVGIGMQFNPDRRVSAQISYGAALQDHARGGKDVQNLGLHFSVLLLLF